DTVVWSCQELSGIWLVSLVRHPCGRFGRRIWMLHGDAAVVDAETRLNYERRVRDLVGLGHRGSATDAERRGAEYLAAELQSLGLEPELESFAGIRSFGVRLLLHIGVAASGAALLWTLPALGAMLGGAALASLVAEASTRRLVLGRLLARRPSANLVAHRPPPSGTASLRLVVCGHYDTQQTGL